MARSASSVSESADEGRPQGHACDRDKFSQTSVSELLAEESCYRLLRYCEVLAAVEVDSANERFQSDDE